MEEKIVKNLRNWLGRYEKSIEKVENDRDPLEGTRRRITLFYVHKYSIFFALEYYERKGIDLPEIRTEYEKITKKLEALEQKIGKPFKDKLFEELKHYVNTYYSTICFFLELDPVYLETENDLDGRDNIEFLMLELNRDYDLHDLEVKVAALDEVLKCQIWLKIDTIMKECPSIEHEYFPDSFWWRHPSKILHEVEESRKEASMM